MSISPRIATILQALLVIGVIGTGFYLYPMLPAEIASHWNASGEVNGYMPKVWGVFLVPILMLAIWLLSVVLRIIDPLKKNLEQFRGPYEFFFVAMNIFFAYIFVLSMAWNLGERFDFGQMLAPALAALMWAIALLIERSKRNWFVGIRTPWTLQSDAVWEKTHQLGSLLFKVTAFSILLGALFPEYLLWFVFVPIVASTFITIVYSYIEFTREVR